jgi:hypothetical protein
MDALKRHARIHLAAGLLAGGVLANPLAWPATSAETFEPPAAVAPALTGRVVAVGIPGAGAISPVGVFHPGGPIHDKPEFAAFTAPGQVLDPQRILVASTSNFGAPLGQADLAPGAILSIDPRDESLLVVPSDLGATGGQAAAMDGRVQLYTAQSPAFANAVNNPDAATAAFPPASNPTAISLNNAFGRPWFANAPWGVAGMGLETVTDPDGRPLAGAPSKVAGGVFAGQLTNREPEQLLPGDLSSAAVGTALLGKSPDDSGRAVFAVVVGDGSVVQVHVQRGVDGLAPAGTIGALSDAGADGHEPAPVGVLRAGMVFNWVPDRIIYVADPARNAVVALTLADDGEIFRLETVRSIQAPELSMPVDLAPAVPEVVNPAFASNTTLAGGADLYVANRGNGTIVRLSQDGKVVAVRQVEVRGLGPLGPGRLNGLAVSPDAQKIWITVSGEVPGFPGLDGAIIEVPAFGAAAS